MTRLVYHVNPKSAPRPRVTKFGTYNDKSYTAWKKGLALIAKTKFKEPLTGAVEMRIDFFFKYPKSWSKKRKQSTIWHTSRPDIDNLQKSCMDALDVKKSSHIAKEAIKGIAYIDDSQVCYLTSRKQYCDNFEGVVIEILAL